jgi:glycine/D-amino acid oxidase-like deaminating enzyme
VGAACALFLSRSGFAVTVLDASFPASGATAAGMGHLVAMDDSEAQFALTSYSISLWRQMFEDLGNFAEAESCGTLWIAQDDHELAEVHRKHRFYSERGVAAEVLGEVETAQHEPMLRRPLAGSLRVAGDAVVYPPVAALTFLDCARRLGAKVLTGWRAVSIARGCVRGSSGTITGDVIINAAGNQAGELSPGVALRPRRGHLVITDRYPGAVRHQIVELGYLRSAHQMSEVSVAFNVQPRATGQILIGSSRELGAQDGGVNVPVLQRMLRRAAHFMPGLRYLSATRVWTGARPTSADKLPMIGPDPGASGVWVAAGHEGLGITTSLATGKLIADMITGSTPAIDVAPFDPSRSSAAWT